MQLMRCSQAQTGEQMQSKWLDETGCSPCKWTSSPVAVTLNASYSTARIRANPPDPRRNATRDPEPPCLAQQIWRVLFSFYKSGHMMRLSCPWISRGGNGKFNSMAGCKLQKQGEYKPRHR
jgi:hypothetical protein